MTGKKEALREQVRKTIEQSGRGNSEGKIIQQGRGNQENGGSINSNEMCIKTSYSNLLITLQANFKNYN